MQVILPGNPFNIEEAIKQIEDGASSLLEKVGSIVTIGGDHTIALPLLRAVNKKCGQPVALVHFDAHLDTWDTYFGAPYTHGTPFRRAREEKLFLDDASMHVGIRGLCTVLMILRAMLNSVLKLFIVMNFKLILLNKLLKE